MLHTCVPAAAAIRPLWRLFRKARGARPGRPVLYVLLTSTAGVIVLFAVVYFVLFTTH